MIAQISTARVKWESDQDNNDVRFEYSCILAKSGVAQDKAEAILHLQHLVDISYSLRETLYELSLVCYTIGDYSMARHFADELYKMDPDTKQISNLHKAICFKHAAAASAARKEQQEVAITTAGVLLGVATLGMALFVSMKKK
jgi:mitochondrial fission 1 protein